MISKTLFIPILFLSLTTLAQEEVFKTKYCKGSLISFDSSFVDVEIHGNLLTRINSKSFVVNNIDTFIFAENIYHISPNPVYDILAVFVGEEDYNDDYAIPENLYFIDINKKTQEKLHFSMKEESEIPNINWSCKGNYICLVFDPWTGISLVKTKNISTYLKNRKPYRTVLTERLPDSPALVFNFIAWKNENEFDFTSACCGDINHVRYNVKINKYNILWKGLYLKYKKLKRKYKQDTSY